MEAIRQFQGYGGKDTKRTTPRVDRGGAFEVVVVHTTTTGTVEALKTAASLARDLGARIRVLVPQIVPFPLPLAAPPVPAEFTERRFRTVIAGARIETRVDIRVCRDRVQMVSSSLKPRSLVVMAPGAPWWPWPEVWLARQLRRQGHHVVMSHEA